MIARKMPLLAGFALAASALTAPAHAESQSVDERLSEQGIVFSIDEDGDYKLGVSWQAEQRSQLVFVSGKTQMVAGLTVREVFAPAALIGEHDIDGKKALALLADSGRAKLGSWEIRGEVVYFVAKVLDSATAQELSAVIDVVAETADDKEIELTGGRDDL
jgi:hypothetical protein